MTDLSKIPDLELRQKVKVISAAIEAIDARIDEIAAPHYEERHKLQKQLDALLGERYLEGHCWETGLPILDGDDVLERRVLACVEA